MTATTPAAPASRVSRLRRLVSRGLRAFGLAPSRRPPFLQRVYPYKVNREFLRALGPELASAHAWQPPAQPSANGELLRLMLSTPNIHKWLHYLRIYERELAALRDRPITMLEIGVAAGGSLALWRRYLHAKSTIVGIDIDPACQQHERAAEGIFVRIGDQADAYFLRAVAREFGPFDVIIDDGSHRTADLIASFRTLFPSALKDGGLYIVEDLHTNYWQEFRNSRLSFIDLAKGLIDVLHAHYVENPGEPYFRYGSPEQKPLLHVPLATALVQRLTFEDSIIVIEKAAGFKEAPISYQT